MSKVLFIRAGIVTVLVLTFILVASTTPPTHAQTSSQTTTEHPTNTNQHETMPPESTTKQPPSEQKSTRVENRKQITAARCTVAETKIDTHIQRLTKVSEKTDGSFNKVIEKAATFITSAEAKNYPSIDTLRDALSLVKSDLNKLQTSHDAYMSALTSTKNFACGESEGDYAKALSSARTTLIDVRSIRASTRADIVTNLIPEMKAYLTWLKSNNEE